MKKLLSLLLAICIVLSLFTVANAENVWTNASNWAISDLNEANSLGLFPTCLKNTDLTQKITRAEQAALSVKIYEVSTGKTAVAATNPFSDTNDTEVLKALNLGVTSGTSATTFEPDASLTREQAATMLSRIYKKINIDGWALDKDNEFKFEFDMPDSFKDHSKISSWAEQSVYFMASKQWILGNELKEFMPLDNCSREQALIIAKRMATFLIESRKEEFKVVCLGGSFTHDDTRWVKAVKDYLQEKLPDMNVIVSNMGYDNTYSDFGAIRFKNNVLDQNPDLVIVDFTVSDMDGHIDYSPYTESMIRQCMNAEDAPGFVFLHAPYPTDESDPSFKMWKKSYDDKESLANHYGIPTINVYEHTKKLYAESGSEAPFMDWIELYFNKTDSGYLPLKPKPRTYILTGEVIVNAFEEKGINAFLKPIENKPVYFTKSTIPNAIFNVIPATDERINYSIGWQLTTINDRYAGWPGYEIPKQYYAFPYYPEGIMLSKTSRLNLTLKTNANAIYVSYVTSSYPLSADVYVGEELIGGLTTRSGEEKDKIGLTKRFPVADVDQKTFGITTTSSSRIKICAIIEEYTE